VFEWLRPFALRGLKSLTVGVGGTLDIEWSELPNLEEAAWLNFEPNLLGRFSKMHPLQRLWLFGSWSFETIDAGSGTDLPKCTSGRCYGIRKEHQYR